MGWPLKVTRLDQFVKLLRVFVLERQKAAEHGVQDDAAAPNVTFYAPIGLTIYEGYENTLHSISGAA